MTPAHHLNDVINSLSLLSITCFVGVATLVRLTLIRLRGIVAHSTAELIESGLLVVVGMFLIVRPFVLQAFFIPSPSMEPTLIGKNGVGDRILVNKLVYRLARPSRGDIVVFLPPASALDGGGTEESPGVPINFIKRLVALPGDRVVVKAGAVWIDGERYTHADIRSRLAGAGVFGDVDPDSDLQADHHVKFTDNAVVVDGAPMPNDRLASLMVSDPHATVRIVPGETIVNGRVLDEPFVAEDPDYDLRIFDGESLKFDPIEGPKLNGIVIPMRQYRVDEAAGPGVVPNGDCLMLGDNRNDSRDSSEWGPLDERRIVGRAQFVFWPPKRVRVIR